MSLSLHGLLLAAALGATDSERTVRAALPATPLVRVLHAQGTLHVVPTAEGAAPSAELHAVCTGGTPEEETRFLESFGIDVTPATDTAPLVVASRSADPLVKPPGLSYQAELWVWLPRDCAVELDCRYGSVAVEGRSAAVTVTSHLGPVEVGGVEGNVRVVNDYDQVHVSRVVGSVEASTNSAELRVDAVTGDVKVVNRFGDVRIEDVQGRVDVEGRMGEVELRRVRDDSVVRAPYCDVQASDFAAGLHLLGNNGKLDCARIGGELWVEHRHSSLHATKVSGRLRVEGDFLPVLAEDLGSDVDLRTTSSTVELRDVAGLAAVEATGGPVVLVDLHGGATVKAEGGVLRLELRTWPAGGLSAPVHLENLRGPLELFLPKEADASVSALSSIGNVQCEFEGMRFEDRGRARSGTLVLGRGTLPLELVCIGNSIQVRASVPDR